MALSVLANPWISTCAGMTNREGGSKPASLYQSHWLSGAQGISVGRFQ